MIVVRSDIVQKSDQYLKELEKQAEAAVLRAMIRTSLVGEKRVKGIAEREAYDTGRFLRSIKSDIRRSADEMILTIGSNLDYAITLEHGRKPGKWPNLDALTSWVGRMLRRKGLNTRVNVSFDQLKTLARVGKGNKATEQQKAYRKHLEVLFLVGRKIATKGVRQKLIFKRLEEGLLAYFRVEAQKELDAL
jgi:hypothetical protein